ncbi:tetratricopeptide repeat protein [Sinomicrobium soli]|uniref:tetratricopeptide repeat protein n=1 Tax=Sinomicrobium sp. N-1-3-6 TaxID=2219864 RepID=UPI000DCF0162|nr:tetratricopeptide repeat protein [Sinomicrobium sp. N-1-3-6]RAV29447.1 ion channel protein [Sinomicrobium sp. N-1-3-6]
MTTGKTNDTPGFYPIRDLVTKGIAILALLVHFPGPGFAQDKSPDTLFDEATALYNEGEYEEAAENYQTILEAGKHSASLYYNLGNTYYKLGSIPESIYYYEKALLLSPDDRDIRNNLAFARNRTIDVIETLPKSGFAKFTERLIHRFHYNSWGIVAIVSAFIAALLFLLYYYKYSPLQKRIFFVASIIVTIAMFISIYIAYAQYHEITHTRHAIVFAKEITVRSEPNDRSENIFELHAGTKVQVLETLNHWKHIQLADGKTGWLPADSVREL